MRSVLALSGTVRRRAIARAEREIALQRELEQPLDDVGRTLGFHREHAMRDAGADGRSEQAVALEHGLRWRQRASASSHSCSNSSRATGRSLVRDAAVAAPLPFGEESLPQLVQEPAALERRAGVLVFRLLFEPQHFRREEPERAIEIALEPADRHAWQAPGPALAPETPRARRPSAARAAAQSAAVPAAASTRTGSSASASDDRHAIVRVLDRTRRQAPRRDVVEQQRRLDDRIVFEREGRDPDERGRRPARDRERPRGHSGARRARGVSDRQWRAAARAARAATRDRARCAARVRAIPRRSARPPAHRRSRRSARPARRRSADPARRCASQTSACRASAGWRRSACARRRGASGS